MDLATNEKAQDAANVMGQDSLTNELKNSTDSPVNNGYIDQILAIAARGWPVFPCGTDKRPLIATGFHVASLDPVQIRTWWKVWPAALVAIPTGAVSGFDVLDVDVKNGQPGLASLAKLVETHGPLPTTLVAETRSGGFHYYFKHVEGARNSASKIAPGIDVRADGGYVIAPPSLGYRWIGQGVQS